MERIKSLSCDTQVCVGNRGLDCMDVEIKPDRPRPSSLCPALPNTPKRDLCFENEVVRAYRIKLSPGESIASAHGVEEGGGSKKAGFAYLAVAMQGAKLSGGEVKAGDNWWCESGTTADRQCNVGDHEAEVMALHPK